MGATAVLVAMASIMLAPNSCAGADAIFDLVISIDTEVPEGDHIVWSNMTVRLEANLLVRGNLSLRNTTLVIGSDGSYGSVQIDGVLYIADLDGNVSTPGDRSELIGGIPGRNADVRCRGSLIMDGSSGAYVNMTGSGISIEGSDLLGTIVRTNDTSLVLRDSSLQGLLYLEGDGGTFEISGCVLSSPIGYTSVLDGCDMMLRNCTVAADTAAVSYRGRCGVSFKGCDIDLFNNGSLLEGGSGPLDELHTFIFDRSVLSRGSADLGNAVTYVQSSIFQDLAYFRGPEGGVIADSTFERCLEAIGEPVSMTIIRNRFVSCQKAITFDESCKVYHNSFTDCDLVAFGSANGAWNSSIEEEGNYYDIYNGLDNGAGGRRADDGIGDTSIPFLGLDHHPLMQDRHWEMPRIPAFFIDHVNGSADITVHILTSAELRYIVQDSTSPDFRTDLITVSTMSTIVTVKDLGNRTHFVRVKAFNDIGARGWSPSRSVVIDRSPLPPSVRSVEPLPEGGALRIGWHYEGEDVTSVWIFYNEMEDDYGMTRVVQYPEEQAVIDDLRNGRTYEFRLAATDGKGQSSRKVSYATGVPSDTTPPDPPRDLNVQAVGNTSVEVTWKSPFYQDIAEYRMMRREAGSLDFIQIAVVPFGRASYRDTGLKDNTSYDYGLIAVDDDGPSSIMAGPVSVRTLHNNNPPEYRGKDMFITSVEDQGPVVLDLSRSFVDPDGDPITLSISYSEPFRTELDGSILRVSPEPDQAGEGYIQMLAFDGEDAVYFVFFVIVEPVPDPPVINRILSPANGSVHLPGGSVKLIGDFTDPDLPTGEVLAVTWRSDLDGLIAFNNASIETAIGYLSTGIHRITLRVKDVLGAFDERNVTIAVGLWGFDPQPWSPGFDVNGSHMDSNGYRITVSIWNDAPVLLSFKVLLEIMPLGPYAGPEKVLVLPAMTDGKIVFEYRMDLIPGELYEVRCNVVASTLNGTFAGEDEDLLLVTVDRVEDDGSFGPMEVLAVIGILACLVSISLLILKLMARKRDKSNVSSGLPRMSMEGGGADTSR